jgi:hypothetical protein
MHVGIATHDKYLIDKSIELINQYAVSAANYEFQMLYGVTPKMGRSVMEKGHRMRVYVPFGKEWLNYFTRIGFVVKHKQIIENVGMLNKDSIRDYLIEQAKLGCSWNLQKLVYSPYTSSFVSYSSGSSVLIMASSKNAPISISHSFFASITIITTDIIKI